MMVSEISFSQSFAIDEAALTPLEREYLYIVSKNDDLVRENKELVKLKDSLYVVIKKTSSHSSLSAPWHQTPEWIKLGTNIKMLNVYRTPSSLYLTLGVPFFNNSVVIDPHSPNFYTESYEFYFRSINSSFLYTNKKESSTMYIDDE